MLQAFKRAWANEPVAILAAIYVLVESVVALVVAFGVELTDTQAVAILALTNAIGGLVLALVGRSQVTPVSKLSDKGRPGRFNQWMPMVLVAVVLGPASSAMGQAKAVINGPTSAAPGDLVILSADGSTGAAYRWQLVGSSKSFLPVNDNRQAVFASGTPGVYHFALAVADATDPLTVDLAIHAVTIGRPDPSPGPDDPPPDQPDTPEVDRLTGRVSQWAAAVDSPTRADEALLIAKAWQDHAITASNFTSLAAITTATSNQYKAALAEGYSVESYLPWSRQVFEPLADDLRQMRDAGQLAGPAQWAVVWHAIAKGFMEVDDAR